MFSSLRPYGLQHPRLLCPPRSTRVCSKLCPLNRWCYVTISSSATLFFCLQTFPASESFPSQFNLFDSISPNYTGLFPPWILGSFTSRNLSYISLHNWPKKCALESFFYSIVRSEEDLSLTSNLSERRYN